MQNEQPQTIYSVITIKVNGHDVTLTTDQPVTDAYLKDIAAHVKAIEDGTAKRAPVRVDINSRAAIKANPNAPVARKAGRPAKGNPNDRLPGEVEVDTISPTDFVAPELAVA